MDRGPSTDEVAQAAGKKTSRRVNRQTHGNEERAENKELRRARQFAQDVGVVAVELVLVLQWRRAGPRPGGWSARWRSGSSRSASGAGSRHRARMHSSPALDIGLDLRD
ncbi:hypothetical protein [Actinomadura sp. 6N118]|uniref:hypothetical protein n=1 Tax=Actinomadura sp. 6N118 TaxID=3375151 RepID=UPI0037A3A182